MKYNTKADLEKAAKSLEDARAIADTARNDGERSMTTDEEKQFDSYMADHQKHEKNAERKSQLNGALSDTAENIEELARNNSKSTDDVAENKAMARQVLKNYLLKGANGLTREEVDFMTRDQSGIVNSEGGYTVDETMSNKIIETMSNFGGMRSVCDILTTSKGEQINYPTNNDTANVGRWLAEKVAATQGDTVFGTAAINAWTASSDYIPVTAQLLQDSAFDIEAYIVKILSTRLGRLSNTAYTDGSGSSQPTGVVNASGFGTAAAADDATTFLEMLDLKHSVDRDYRVNGTWMFNDNTLLALKKISLASANQSLWQPGVIAGEPATIDGQIYTVNNDMPDMAAGEHAILYGDFKHYLIRDAQGINIRRSEHVNFLKNEITFVGELRTDGKLLDTAAVKHMRMLKS
jgi:HK97 family phage major capsid protein